MGQGYFETPPNPGTTPGGEQSIPGLTPTPGEQLGLGQGQHRITLEQAGKILEELHGRVGMASRTDAPVPEISKQEISALLQDPAKLKSLCMSHWDKLDLDRDGFVSNTELEKAAHDSSQSPEVRLLAATLAFGYNTLADLSETPNNHPLFRPLGEMHFPHNKGVSKADVLAYAQAKDFIPPNTFSPTSPSLMGSVERGAVLAAPLLIPGNAGKFLTYAGYGAGFLAFAALNRLAIHNEDLQNRHDRIKRLLESAAK